MFALVAMPVPLGQAFSYVVPAALGELAVPGARVLCEFGRRKLLGVVLTLSSEPPAGVPSAKLKPILSVLDSEPALPPELLRFLMDLAAYYVAPIGEVMRMALPAIERGQLQALHTPELFQDAEVETVGKLAQVASLVSGAEEPTELRGQARSLFRRLSELGPTPVSDLAQEFGNARAALKRMEALGCVRIERKAVALTDPFASLAVERDEPPELNEAQAAAVAAIEASLAGAPQGFLLDGITGSGKTEVYLHAVRTCLEGGRGALVLVPEIALTPQLVSRFRARFGDKIAVLHSGLTEQSRQLMWRRLRSGEFLVAVGARSALFAPLPDLALICVDEEHDGSFKQEEGVRYHARDMALLRAHRARATIVLGSATPSLASEALVRRDKLRRLRLPTRANVLARLPSVEVVNLRQVGAGPSGHRLISLPLHRELEAVLANKKQAILFLNRRGFAPSLLCGACGEVVSCPNCAVALTVHRARGEHLRCHYCDFRTALPLSCEHCKAQRFSQEGAGTERIEEVLQKAFPTARIARLDRDVAEGLKSEAILSRMRSGELDILVGTQMVTKGHDLPNVALVGVLNADAALSLPDYQAAERTFQLLVQVAGRAGRAGTPGKVIVQTRQPDHAAIRLALRHETHAFVERELAERRDALYPPFARLLMVRLSALDEDAVKRASHEVAAAVRLAIGQRASLLGPAPAPIERLRNRFRYRFIVRSATRPALYAAARAVLNGTWDRRVRISVDMDPVSML